METLTVADIEGLQYFLLAVVTIWAFLLGYRLGSD